jgi:hypothetical protein
VNPSSPVRVPTDHRVGAQHGITARSLRDARRERQHLYPLEDYEAAIAVGGIVRSFCGVFVRLTAQDDTAAVEAIAPEAEDCVTCVDVWYGRHLVRL